MKQLIIITLISLASSFAASNALDFTLGTINPGTDKTAFNLDFSGNYWYQWDQMVLLGGGGGVQQFGNKRSYQALLGGIFRLPIGGQMLPIITGNWGYSFGQRGEFLYKAGGGFDLKLGDNSSLLAVGGYQSNTHTGSYIYLRGGILLEF
ncbi:MAG: hypothetical protein OCD01_10560 [Fibrobacterales bacterium]